jgi:hypothetical protein
VTGYYGHVPRAVNVRVNVTHYLNVLVSNGVDLSIIKYICFDARVTTDCLTLSQTVTAAPLALLPTSIKLHATACIHMKRIVFI